MTGGEDTAAILRLGTWGPRALLALFIVTHVVLALTAGDVVARPIGIGALLAAIAAGVVVITGTEYPIRRARTAIVLALVAIATVLGDLSLPPDGRGFTAWHLGAGSFVLFAMAFRGRIAVAWAGAGMVFCITLVWSLLATGDALAGVDLYYGQVASLFAGTFFALLLRGTATRIRRFQAIESERAARELDRRVGDEERSRQIGRLRELVVPPLTLIADGHPSADDRRDFRLLEAALRDTIRGRSLQREPLTSSVRAARLRGCQVVMLDDTGDTSAPAIDEGSARWASDLLDATQAGMITVRVSGTVRRTLTVSADDSVAESLSVPT